MYPGQDKLRIELRFAVLDKNDEVVGLFEEFEQAHNKVLELDSRSYHQRRHEERMKDPEYAAAYDATYEELSKTIPKSDIL